MITPILYREELKEYDFGPGHPFRGDRFQIFPKFLRERLKPDNYYRFLSAETATESDLELICQPDYIKFCHDYYKSANLGQEDDSQFFQYQSLDNHPIGRPGKVEEAARMVIGQAKMAADLVHGGKYKKVISVGGGLHHAKGACGEGFCLYNDVAFTGMYLQKHHKLERILILDTDAHAGNGTAEYFFNDPQVLFIDIHQDPRTIYPGTGFASDIGGGDAKGKTINIPMPINAGYSSYKMVFEEIIQPVTEEFQPQIIIRNGGSDPHFADELTSLGLTIAGFELIGQKVKKMADVCGGKEIDLIASGYNKEVLPYCWLALLSGLTDWNLNVEDPIPPPPSLRIDTKVPQTKLVVAEVIKNLKDYWHCF
ncbi:MAG: histone deacetylase [Dehalococcoidales bacterium]|nr:histone deacetylase [Dehalococcoidales bacterium]